MFNNNDNNGVCECLLVALTQVGNIYIIGLSETWLELMRHGWTRYRWTQFDMVGSQHMCLLAKVVIHGHKIFSVNKPTPTGREVDQLCMSKHFEPNSKKVSSRK